MLPMMAVDQQRFVITLLPHKGHFLFFPPKFFMLGKNKESLMTYKRCKLQAHCCCFFYKATKRQRKQTSPP